MNYIPEEVINEIKTNIDITELIGQYIQLSKRGTNFMASCPFHEDRNPSFSVSQTKQIYKCFSCGRGGNLFGFLQEMEGISFPEAVIKAAEFADISIPEQYSQAAAASETRNELKYLYDIHQKVADYYHYYLMNTTNGEAALNYLNQRSFTNDILAEFQLGVAPNNSDIIVQYLLKSNFSEEQLLNSGIFYLNKQDKLIDRFRNRIIFPLRNERGQTVAFSGRVYGPQTENSGPKYLNSPDTPLFNKGNLIFNMDKARLPIRQNNFVLVTEGYMDVISLYRAGFQNAVASMGTSLTNQHLSMLSKQTDQIYFVFDGDEAGQNAIHKAFTIAKELPRIDAKAVVIPNKQDPDEFIQRNGADGFSHLITQSLSYFEFMKIFLKKNYRLENEDELAKYIEQIIKLIAQLSSPIEQQLRIQDLVNEYNLNDTLVEEQVARVNPVTTPAANAQPQYEPSYDIPPSEETFMTQDSPLTIEAKRAFQSEKQIIFNLIYYEEAWAYMEALESPPVFYHDFANEAFFSLDKYYYDGNKLPLTGIVDTIENTQVNDFLTSLLWEEELIGYSNIALDDCFKVIKEEFVQKEIKELRHKLTQYKKEQNFVEINTTLNKIMSLTRQIKAI